MPTPRVLHNVSSVNGTVDDTLSFFFILFLSRALQQCSKDVVVRSLHHRIVTFTMLTLTRTSGSLRTVPFTMLTLWRILGVGIRRFFDLISCSKWWFILERKNEEERKSAIIFVFGWRERTCWVETHLMWFEWTSGRKNKKTFMLWPRKGWHGCPRRARPWRAAFNKHFPFFYILNCYSSS